MTELVVTLQDEAEELVQMADLVEEYVDEVEIEVEMDREEEIEEWAFEMGLGVGSGEGFGGGEERKEVYKYEWEGSSVVLDDEEEGWDDRHVYDPEELREFVRKERRVEEEVDLDRRLREFVRRGPAVVGRPQTPARSEPSPRKMEKQMPLRIETSPRRAATPTPAMDTPMTPQKQRNVNFVSTPTKNRKGKIRKSLPEPTFRGSGLDMRSPYTIPKGK
jgi:hypothetical protein